MSTKQQDEINTIIAPPPAPLFPRPKNPRKWKLPVELGGRGYKDGDTKYIGVVEGGDLWSVSTISYPETHFFYVRENVAGLIFVWSRDSHTQKNYCLFQDVDPAPEPVLAFIQAYCRLLL